MIRPAQSATNGISESWGMRLIEFIGQHLFAILTIPYCLWAFDWRNETTVVGNRRNLLRRGMAIVSSHSRLNDSFALSWKLLGWRMIWRPDLLPWHMPRSEFFSTPLLRIMMSFWRTIHVRRDAAGRSNASDALRRAIRTLRDEHGVVEIFIEGEVSDNGFLPPLRQVGTLVRKAEATVLPVCILNTTQPFRMRPGELPKTRWRVLGETFECFFQVDRGGRCLILIGEEISPYELRLLASQTPAGEDSAQFVADAIMERIINLHREYLRTHPRIIVPMKLSGIS